MARTKHHAHATAESAPAIQGHATARGTARFRSRHVDLAADHFRELPGGVIGSSIGIGTYLGECDAVDDARYTASVTRAVGLGINLIDTAINYRCQRSERAVGQSIRQLIDHGGSRDELIVCTKGGYIPLDGTPPESREEYQSYLRRTFFDENIMTPGDVVAGGHCLAPRYLLHQIAASRANLGVQTIDLYYLHNPEQQLAAIGWDELRHRLLAAFRTLEGCVSTGEIREYGCATWNGFRVPESDRGHLPLAQILDVAREAGGRSHHFTAVQLPVNLAMPEAVRVPTQRLPDGRTVTVLEAAHDLGLRVVASGSLLQGRLTAGLPEPLRASFPELTTDAQRALAFVRALPGVTTALVGMKRLEHVDENVAVVRRNR